MKHSYILLSSLVLLACCTNENEIMTPETAVEGNTALVAKAEQYGTRANYVKNDGQFFWTYGDHISVTTTTGQTSFGISSGAGTATATFLGNLGEGEEITCYAWYNGRRNSASGYGIVGDSVLNCWLDETYWIHKDFDSEFNTEAKPDAQSSNVPLFAKFDNGEDLKFKMLCGAVAIQLKNLPENARWITFSTDKIICGRFNVDITAKDPQINTTSNAGGENSVKVYVEIGAETENCVIYIPLPCGTYEKFEITVSDEDNNPVGHIVSEKTRVVNRRQIRYFSNTEVDEFVDEDITEAIEDPALLSWLLDRYDSNEDGRLSTVEAWRIDNIDFDAGEEWVDSIGEWMPAGKIHSLKGFEHLQNLRYINLSCHQIDSADFSKNSKLETISIERNPMKSINVTGCTSLRYFNINNRSKWIDNREVAMGKVSEIKGLGTCTNLHYLHVENNQFESLDLSNLAQLEEVSCSRNPLTTLDVSNNPLLRRINCNYGNYRDENDQEVSDGNLTEIKGLANCTELEQISIEGNKLVEIDLGSFPNLRYLNVNYNKIESIDVSNLTQLEEVSCSHNPLIILNVGNNPLLRSINCSNRMHWDNEEHQQVTDGVLKEIEGLANCVNLESIDIAGNKFAEIDLLPFSKLRYARLSDNYISIVEVNNSDLDNLDCANNKIDSLNIIYAPKLVRLSCDRNELVNLNLGNVTTLESLNCHNNKIVTLDLSNNLNLMNVNCRCETMKEIILADGQTIEQFDYNEVVTITRK